jgi:hypothetical protein
MKASMMMIFTVLCVSSALPLYDQVQPEEYYTYLPTTDDANDYQTDLNYEMTSSPASMYDDGEFPYPYPEYEDDVENYYNGEDTYPQRLPPNQKFIRNLWNNMKGWGKRIGDNIRSGNVLGAISQFNPVNKVAQWVAPNSRVTNVINKAANIGTRIGFHVLVHLCNVEQKDWWCTRES